MTRTSSIEGAPCANPGSMNTAAEDQIVIQSSRDGVEPVPERQQSAACPLIWPRSLPKAMTEPVKVIGADEDAQEYLDLVDHQFVPSACCWASPPRRHIGVQRRHGFDETVDADEAPRPDRRNCAGSRPVPASGSSRTLSRQREGADEGAHDHRRPRSAACRCPCAAPDRSSPTMRDRHADDAVDVAAPRRLLVGLRPPSAQDEENAGRRCRRP